MVHIVRSYRSFGDGAAFSPEDVSGLFFWMDANDSTKLWKETGQSNNVSADGDPVNSWVNKASGGASESFTPESAIPVWRTNHQNGLAVVEMDLAQLHRTGEIAAFESSFTMFIAWEDKVSAGQYGGQMFGTDRASASSLQIMTETRDDPNRLVVHASNILDLDSNPGPNPKYASLTIDTTGDAVNGWLKGTALSGNPASYTLTPVSNDMHVGGYSGWAMQGYMYEMLAYNSVLSTTDRQSVESYLASRWNIT